jgi:nucleoid-associated protein YgaU
MRLESTGKPAQPESTKFKQPAVKSEVQAANRSSEAANIKLLGTEVVTSEMTLSQLARKYYGNTFCWVYIYAMNKSAIRNPNRLQIGQKIRIPELNEVDRQITKQEAEEYYRMIRK